MTASAEARAELERRSRAVPDGLLAAFTLPVEPESRPVGARARPDGAGLIRTVQSRRRRIADREFTANAVQHAGSPVDVVLITAGRLLLIIAAHSSRTPPAMSATDDSESGAAFPAGAVVLIQSLV